MVELLQGFVLTRHWRDTPAGTEVAFWLATEQGPRQVRLPPQPSVAFVLAEQGASSPCSPGRLAPSCGRWRCATSSSGRCSACTASSIAN